MKNGEPVYHKNKPTKVGTKRLNFFPENSALNEYYNQEANGGNQSEIGHFKHPDHISVN